MTRHLLVPGRGAPRPEHWLQRWADAHPEYVWAPPPPGPPFILEQRVAALHEAIAATGEPAVLIAHSAGCLAVVAWASRHAGPVRGALLVAPPYIDPDWRPGPFDGIQFGDWVVPREKLLFGDAREPNRRRSRAIVVASRSDPYATFAQSEQYAEDWGAELVDAGDAGHIDTAAGYGPWPDGERLVGTLS